jgi:hypothetical protein
MIEGAYDLSTTYFQVKKRTSLALRLELSRLHSVDTVLADLRAYLRVLETHMQPGQPEQIM